MNLSLSTWWSLFGWTLSHWFVRTLVFSWTDFFSRTCLSWWSNWACFPLIHWLMSWNVLNCWFVLESCKHISSLNLFDLSISVLCNELINMHVSSTNSYKNLITLFNLDIHTFLSELVDTFAFSQKHDLHLCSLRIGVQIVSENLVDFIVFMSNINSLVFLKLFIDLDHFKDLFLSCLKFVFTKLELVKKI